MGCAAGVTSAQRGTESRACPGGLGLDRPRRGGCGCLAACGAKVELDELISVL